MITIKPGKFYLIIAIASIMIMPPCYAAKIYKWVDENGVMQFSTQPPLEQQKKQFEEVKVGNEVKKTTGYQDFHWYMFDGGIKYTLLISKDRYSLRKEAGNSSTTRYGKLSIEGKTLTVKYEQHEDKTKTGSQEIFYLADVTDKQLVLISDLTGKHYEYTKDAADSGYSERSSVEKEMFGNWQGIAGSDSIRFTETKFIIRGKSQHGSGDFKYWARTERYRGKWYYDNPYLNLEVHEDLVHLKEELPSRVGKQLKYQVLENTGERMVLLTPDKRKKWTLLKVNK